MGWWPRNLIKKRKWMDAGGPVEFVMLGFLPLIMAGIGLAIRAIFWLTRNFL